MGGGGYSSLVVVVVVDCYCRRIGCSVRHNMVEDVLVVACGCCLVLMVTGVVVVDLDS